jgi:hypothetical protein
MFRVTSDNTECGMWNVGWCIDVKNENWYVMFSSIIWKLEQKSVVVKHVVGKGVIVDSEKQMYRWVCMAKTL